MPVDQFFTERFGLIADIANWEEVHSDPVKERRLRQYEASEYHWDFPAGVETEDRRAPGPHGDVPVRVFRPSAESGDTERPAVLWMHGGGFVGGDLDMPESHAVGAELAARAHAVVVSVDYRLSNDGIRFPIPLDDVCAAWQWLDDHREELGITGGLYIGGGSAGAGLAAGAVLRFRDEKLRQADGVLLAYPGVHFPLPALEPCLLEEKRLLPKVTRIELPLATRLQRNYAGSMHNVSPYAAPGQANLTGLPPVHLVISEYDDLRSSGELFAEQLEAAGVSVTCRPAPGMLHGHLAWLPGEAIPEVARTIDFFAGAVLAGSASGARRTISLP